MSSRNDSNHAKFLVARHCVRATPARLEPEQTVNLINVEPTQKLALSFDIFERHLVIEKPLTHRPRHGAQFTQLSLMCIEPRQNHFAQKARTLVVPHDLKATRKFR